MEEFDIAVLGAGMSGISAALRGADRGARVCLIEKDRVGGRCVYEGLYKFQSLMDPLKLLVASERTSDYGIGLTQNGDIDVQRLFQHAEVISQAVSDKWESHLENSQISLYKGRGRLVNPHSFEVQMAGEQIFIKAKKIIVATGSHPSPPPTVPFDGDRIISSDEIFKNSEIPKNLLIVGGGTLGCELATLFNRLGSRVFLSTEDPRLIPEQDPDLISSLESQMKTQKIKVLPGKKLVSLFKDVDKIDITLEGGVKFSADRIVLADGRKANSADLDADRLGIRLGEQNEVLINEGLESSLPGVYAVGSVTGRRSSANYSEEEGRVAADNALGGQKVFNPDWIPFMVWTDPQIASVGCFLRDAHHKGFRAVEGRCDSRNLDHSLLCGETEGLYKIVADKTSRMVIGAQVVSRKAAEIIPLVLLAIRKGLKVSALAALPCGSCTEMEGIRQAAKACDLALKEGLKSL